MRRGAVLAVAVLLTAGQAAAAGVAGQVTFVKGNAETGATVAGPFQPLKRGGAVREGEFVKTGPDSRTEIKFADGSVMRLGSGTTMQLGQARPNRPGLPQEVTLSSGLVWARISKLAGGEKFAVRTHNAVAGVRGTVFQLFFARDGSTTLVVFEGEVAMANALGAFEKSAAAGKGVVVLPDGTVMEPVSVEEILAKAEEIEADWAQFNKDRDVAKDSPVEGETPPKEGAAPKEEAGLKVRDDISKLTPQEMGRKAEAALTEMRNSLRTAVELVGQARKQKDIVRLNCLNERVTQMKGVLKVAEDANVALQEASGGGDLDSVRSQYTKIAKAQERVGQLRVQAQNCVGVESYYGGDTEVVTEINPEIAGGDTFFGDSPVGSDPRAKYENNTSNPGDNTGTDTPAPPPPSSSFTD
ncbi:MAG: FecR domain-containing protein [Deltaproteobacteria bacterium]|nr:FecR domain-containing protein [Deltaproteobacteria bacterium]